MNGSMPWTTSVSPLWMALAMACSLVLEVDSFLLYHPSVASRRSLRSHTPSARSLSKADGCGHWLGHRYCAVPEGRVEDVLQWLQWSSDSLERFTGRSLVDEMDGEGGVKDLSEVTDCERYAVLSHGTQDDPIYCYFNKGALQQFQHPESEIYTLPSRYSAPDGKLRSDRAVMMQQMVDEDVRKIPTAVRETKFGRQFQLTNVILWNVFHPETGERVGQTAVFDRDLVVDL